MILLTGASGFIGNHILKKLVLKYGSSQVVAMSSNPVPGCFNVLHKNYAFKKEDFLVDKLYDRITVIVHAGAFIPKSSKNTDEVTAFKKNLEFTENLCTLDFPALERVIFISTTDIYKSEEIINESSTVDPVSLYSESKWQCEKWLESWSKSADKKLLILRLGHIYGPGEGAYQKVIPNTFRNILKGNEIEVWGNGAESRSFLYVKDAAEAVLKAIELPDAPGVINVASSHEISVLELIKEMVKVSNAENPIVFKPLTITPRNIKFDTRNMRKWLLLEETSLQQGLEEEWNYFKNEFSVVN